MSSKIFLGAALALSAALTSVQGASISNGNFDTDVVGGFTQAAPASWSESGSGAFRGLLNVAANPTSGISNHSPANVAYLTDSRVFSQGISENVADNLSVKLDFKVGVRADGTAPTDFEAGFYTTGGTELAKATVTDVAGGLTTALKSVSLQFDAGVGHGQLGQAIEVRLISTSGSSAQIIFDDVAVSVVPEPTTYALISGLGLIGMAAYRRHKLRQA